jgi:RimJ/RimL family protein N-acetyltransferase
MRRVDAVSVPALSDGVIRLRPWTAADAPLLMDASADAAIQRFSLHRSRPFTLAEAEEQLRDCETTWLTFDRLGRPTGSLVITDTATGASLGQCGVDGWSDGDVAQIGYWLLPPARGRGIATGALVKLTSWLFELGAQRVFLTVVEENHASIRVAQRAGFACEGPIDQREMWNGRSHEILRFALTAHDWSQQRSCE